MGMMRHTKLHNAIRGAGGGGGGASTQPRQPIEHPDSLHSTAYMRILDLVSEGEIFGFADQAHPMRCMFLNETPIENDDGTQNFRNLNIESRVGTQTQAPIKGIPGVENEIGVSTELRFGTPWTHEFTNLNLTAIRIRLSTPALRQTDLSTGDTTGYAVNYKIELAVDGGPFTQLVSTGFNGKTSTKYERPHRIDLPPADEKWTVRVTRLTANSELSNVSDLTFIESYAEIIDAKFRMPMSALVSCVIDAEQFNQVPARAFHMKGRLIKVPSNYNPDTGVYTGVWDGTFQIRYSNNPAWVFYDMVTNDRYGLGHLVPVELVDKWALYEIGVYCDGLVPDGFGGTERRFTANLYLQTRADALRVMQDMASMFRGIMYASGGAITPVADMPADPVYTYTPANVIDGKFLYSGSARRVRHTVALVSWNDMSDFGRAKIEYVEDEEGIARYGVQETEVIAVGCTSRGQARRMGKYILASERYETDTVSFAVGLDGTFAAPGKIINIADPLRAGKRMSGRCRQTNWGWIVPDVMPEDVEAGDMLTCIMPNGMPHKTTIIGVGVVTLTVEPNFPDTPPVESVWLVEKDVLNAQTFRVLGVEEADDGMSYTMSAVQHVAGKFDFVELDIDIEEPPITDGITKIVFAPEEVILTVSTRSDDFTIINVLNADWENVVGATAYGVQWKRDNDDWTPVQVVRQSNVDFVGAAGGVWYCRVHAINAAGYTSADALSDPLVVTAPEAIVKQLDIVAGNVEIDCAYSQFELLLDANVTSVTFINVSMQDTIIITIEQGGAGSHTIDFGPSVVPVNGVPYVPTVTVGARDVLGLNTINTGALWQLVYQKAGSGSGGGDPLVVTASPSPASGTVTYVATPNAPSVAVTATAAGGAGGYTYAWTRADSTGGTNFTLSSTSVNNPTFSVAVGTASYLKTQQWRCTVTDSAGAVATVLVNVTLKRQIAGGMVVSITPDPAFGSCGSAPDAPCTPLVSCTASVTGAVGTLTYAWTRVGAGGSDFITTSTNTATCAFRYARGLPSIDVTQTWRCTVTSSTGQTDYEDVVVNLQRDYSPI